MPSLPLAVLAAVGVLVPVSGAVALDPRIEQSRAELGGARDTAAAAAAALDHAAASYERRVPTSRPLTIEQQQAPEDVEAASAARGDRSRRAVRRCP